jgi:hypothetical protein
MAQLAFDKLCYWCLYYSFQKVRALRDIFIFFRVNRFFCFSLNNYHFLPDLSPHYALMSVSLDRINCYYCTCA